MFGNTIVLNLIGICLFPSINGVSNAKKHSETHRPFSQCLLISRKISVTNGKYKLL